MNYIHVTSRPAQGDDKLDYTLATAGQVIYCLYSLISGLNQKWFRI